MLHAGYERAPLPPARRKDAAAADGASEPQARAEEKPAAKQRDPFLDNAKYLTIVLVAIGHAWDPLRDDSRTASALYFVLYAFHMPAFIIISGYLSRSFQGKPKQIQRLITGVVVPYVVFQIVYTFFMRWATDNPDREFHLQEPGFALWFLLALFFWRLTTPLWRYLRWPLPVSLVIGAAASVTPTMTGDLDMMRLLQLLPFFVLGLQLRPDHFTMVKKRELRLAALPVVAVALAIAYWAVPRMSKGWFLHDKAAQELGVPAWVGLVMYLAIFGCGLVLTVCFLSWVPRRHMWFTALGAGTLYAYLLHIYPIKASREFEWYDMSWVDHPLSRVGITVLAAVGMTLLCTAPVRRTFKFVMEPELNWFFRADPADAARRREKATADAPPAAAGSRQQNGGDAAHEAAAVQDAAPRGAGAGRSDTYN